MFRVRLYLECEPDIFLVKMQDAELYYGGTFYNVIDERLTDRAIKRVMTILILHQNKLAIFGVYRIGSEPDVLVLDRW